MKIIEVTCPVCNGCGYNDNSNGFAGWATECPACNATGKIKQMQPSLEQPIDRLRRICKIEGVGIHDDAAVIKLCGEYMDGDALLAAYREWRKAGWMQAAIDSGLISKPYDGTN